MINVLVWNEYAHEKTDEAVRAIYPEGIHAAVAEFLSQESDFSVSTATLDDPECGLTEETLQNTDVLIWWGHMKHASVPDEVAIRVQNAVLSGMGFIALHSAHHSKPFRRFIHQLYTVDSDNLTVLIDKRSPAVAVSDGGVNLNVRNTVQSSCGI